MKEVFLRRPSLCRSLKKNMIRTRASVERFQQKKERSPMATSLLEPIARWTSLQARHQKEGQDKRALDDAHAVQAAVAEGLAQTAAAEGRERTDVVTGRVQQDVVRSILEGCEGRRAADGGGMEGAAAVYRWLLLRSSDRRRSNRQLREPRSLARRQLRQKKLLNP